MYLWGIIQVLKFLGVKGNVVVYTAISPDRKGGLRRDNGYRKSYMCPL